MSSIDRDIVEEISRVLDRPIVLIGMMGAGKTRMGRQIADVLNLDFVDSDDEIEKAAGMEIAEIFDKFGEDYFRDGERRVIERLIAKDRGVIATGGGAVMSPQVAEEIWSKTLSIWVRADLDIMVERTSRKDNRPLLKDGNPEEILRELSEKRYPVYEKADIVIDSHNGPTEAILNQVLERIQKFLRHEQRKSA